MRKIFLFFLLLVNSSLASAENGKDLHIGINYFSPPFIIPAGSNGFAGFDVSMMVYLCEKMHRTCKFHTMRFNELISGVQEGEVDVALSALTITYQRSKYVNFSNPYLLSSSRFLGPIAYSGEKLKTSFFRGKTVGIKRGTIFAKQMSRLGLDKVRIKTYAQDNQMIDALSQNKVDLVLTDNETAVYWQNHSSGKLIALGRPLKYGYGYGIAINKKDPDLVRSINRALSRYHKSMQFRSNYSTYIAGFSNN